MLSFFTYGDTLIIHKCYNKEKGKRIIGEMEINIYDYSYSFALKIIRVCTQLNDRKEFILSKQLLRSGTSIGANLREAKYAQSKKDFLNKMNIALKEEYETEYWIELLKESNILDESDARKLLSDCEVMRKILASIVKTTRDNLNSKSSG